MEMTFPEDERMPLEEYCDYFLSDKYKDNHHLEATDDYMILWCDLEKDLKVIEFFVVSPSKRDHGFGTKIFSDWIDRNEKPKLMMEIDSDKAYRFRNKFGIKQVSDYDYVQPPLKQGMNPVTTLRLSTNFSIKDKKEVDRIVKLWFKYGFGIENED